MSKSQGEKKYKSWEETLITNNNPSTEEHTSWEKEFDEKFVDKPEHYVRTEEPYKIGDRNYTGEHLIYPGFRIKESTSPGELKRFIASLLEQQKKELREKIEEVLSKKADGYNTEWGVDTCAALIAVKIDILKLLY